MPYEKIAELKGHFQLLNSFDEVVQSWLQKRNEMQDFTTMFAFDDISENNPIEAIIGSYDSDKFYVRSIFCKPNICLFNEDIWLSLNGDKKSKVPCRRVLCFDTQFGRYACDYLKSDKFKNKVIGKSFDKLIRYIYANDMHFDFSFYLYENFSNFVAGDEKEIRNQLFALKKLADLDRKVFIDTGDVKLPYDHVELEKKVDDLIKLYKKENTRSGYFKKEYIQSMIATVIIKSALIKREDIPKEQKVIKLVEFLNEEISGIPERELFICSKWLMGEELSIFDPINGGPSLYEVSQKINGIAWDFMLLRHVEQYCSWVENGEYKIAYYTSFDEKLIETLDIFKYKGCLFPPKKLISRYFMLSENDYMSWIGEIIGSSVKEKVFTDQAWKRREENKISMDELSILRSKLEYKLIKKLSPKKR